MKFAISYFIGVVVLTVVVGLVKDPLIAFAFFMAINILAAILASIVTILGGFKVEKK